MMIFHLFKLNRDGKEIEGPTLGTSDIEKLKSLFPDNDIWKARASELGNVYFPTTEQAKALYDALVRYYCSNEISGEQYPTGNFSGTFLVTSSLLSVFNDLIDFFEKELGFKKTEEAEQVITTKREAHKKAEETEKSAFRKKAIETFASLPALRKPTNDNLLKRLEKKLSDYNERQAECFQHPTLALAVNQQYRFTTFKIEILSAVLGLKENNEITPSVLVAGAFDRYKENLDIAEYFTAFAIIAHYLGTPIPGCEVQKELPQVEAVA